MVLVCSLFHHVPSLNSQQVSHVQLRDGGCTIGNVARPNTSILWWWRLSGQYVYPALCSSIWRCHIGPIIYQRTNPAMVFCVGLLRNQSSRIYVIDRVAKGIGILIDSALNT